jgi:5,10-methylene-tetrahydrofolate dehydrogenase/methenyl tetrahydrofolate cyclohydrolase
MVNENTTNVSAFYYQRALILSFLGVGKPNLLTKDMVKEGVVVFDAGASEDGGLVGG